MLLYKVNLLNITVTQKLNVFTSVCDSVRGKWKLSDSRDSESVHVELMTPNLFS